MCCVKWSRSTQALTLQLGPYDLCHCYNPIRILSQWHRSYGPKESPT